MLIREYEASSLKECLTQIRNELGPEAIILDTRKARKGGVLGIGARDMVRVVAATGLVPREKAATTLEGPQISSTSLRETTKAASKSTPSSPAAARAYRTLAAMVSEKPEEEGPSRVYPQQQMASPLASETKKNHDSANPTRARKTTNATALLSTHDENATSISEPTKRAPATSTEPARNLHSQKIGDLEKALEEIRSALNTLQQQQRLSQEQTVTAVVSALAPVVAPNAPTPLVLPACPEIYQKLIEVGVEEALARELVENLPDVSRWSEQARLPMALSALSDLIARRIPVAPPITYTPGKLTTVVFIGPTGVGKTTTIAKLAARFALIEKRRVALLTVDTYRIAAVEQLKTYAQIMDIPVRVAYDQTEAAAAVREFQGFDILLIDTAGRSQKNTMQVGELKSLIDRLEPQSCLVLSACMKESDMLQAVERFAKARVDSLIFTKLDETNSCGSLLNILERTGLPLAYFTTGQKVPEDIEAADGRRLARIILDGM